MKMAFGQEIQPEMRNIKERKRGNRGCRFSLAYASGYDSHTSSKPAEYRHPSQVAVFQRAATPPFSRQYQLPLELGQPNGQPNQQEADREADDETGDVAQPGTLDL